MRIPGTPLVVKQLKLGQSLIFIRCLIDPLEIVGDSATVSWCDVFQTTANHMKNADLKARLRVFPLNGLRETFNPIDARNQDVLNASIFEFFQYRGPKWYPSFFRQPKSQNVLVAFCIKADRQIQGLAYHLRAIMDFEFDTIEIYDRIHGREGAVLPSGNLFGYLINDLCNSVRGNVQITHFFERNDYLVRA